MSFPRYPAYKDSGVEWLGEVPGHWEVRRLKRNLLLLTERAEQRDFAVALENIESWTGRFIESDSELQGEGVAFEAGDILFGKLRPYLAKAWVAEGPGEAVGDFHVLRPTEEAFSRFTLYQILTAEFISTVDGATFGAKMPRVGWDFLSTMPLATPPFREQTAIASFLDRETAKIDALAAEYRTLIDLLKEKRQAVISHAVTKGLDPTVPMKDSGVEWLGEVPEHWKVIRLGRCIELQRGVDITKDEQTEGAVPVVSSGGVASFHAVRFARGPGVIVGRKGTVGSVYFIESDYWPHDTTLYVREFRGSFPRYVFFELIAMNLASFDTGSANPALNRNLVHPTLVSWPPLAEQVLIADFLGEQTAKLDGLVAEAEQAVALLQERRTALISAAVTGKIDVRGLVEQEAA